MKCCSLYRYLTIHSGPSVMGTELCFPQLSTISLFDGNNQFKVSLAIIGQLKCGLTVRYRPKPTSFSKSKPSISILSWWFKVDHPTWKKKSFVCLFFLNFTSEFTKRRLSGRKVESKAQLFDWILSVKLHLPIDDMTNAFDDLQFAFAIHIRSSIIIQLP